MSDRDEVDRGISERFVEIKCFLTRDPKDVPDALRLQAFDKDI
jgi:hypothetical protein